MIQNYFNTVNIILWSLISNVPVFKRKKTRFPVVQEGTAVLSVKVNTLFN
jgi:hypothetical protein